MKNEIKFSIVIPVKKINAYILENVRAINSIRGNLWELIIVSNFEKYHALLSKNRKIKIISSGKVSPAIKRDIGTKISKGKYLVFLDDDSYPDINFLYELDKLFLKNKNVTAIGGPAITPINNNYKQKLSGSVFLSKFTGGNPERYLAKGKSKYVDDWPTVNFSIKKKDFLDVGGFDSLYWPGEDTFLCYKLSQKKKKIFYSPQIIVWHHRRSGLLKHLIQISAYGLHRGFFARKYSGNSFKLKYFIPSIFNLFFIISFCFLFTKLYFLSIFFYLSYIVSLFLGFVDIMKNSKMKISFEILLYIFFTHIFYGYNFLKGYLFIKELKSRLR